MFGRRLKPDFKSKEYSVVDEDTYILKTIVVPPKYSLINQIFLFILGFYTLIYIVLGTCDIQYSMLLGIIMCILTTLYLATESDNTQ